MIYANGSVTRDLSGWGSLPSKVEELYVKTVVAYTTTTSSLTMDVEAVTRAVQFLASKSDIKITHAMILTDSMNLLQNVESRIGCPSWHAPMHSLRLHKLLWISCHGHARVRGNERTDRLTSTADIMGGLQLVKANAERLEKLSEHVKTTVPQP